MANPTGTNSNGGGGYGATMNPQWLLNALGTGVPEPQPAQAPGPRLPMIPATPEPEKLSFLEELKRNWEKNTASEDYQNKTVAHTVNQLDLYRQGPENWTPQMLDAAVSLSAGGQEAEVFQRNLIGRLLLDKAMRSGEVTQEQVNRAVSEGRKKAETFDWGQMPDMQYVPTPVGGNEELWPALEQARMQQAYDKYANDYALNYAYDKLTPLTETLTKMYNIGAWTRHNIAEPVAGMMDTAYGGGQAWETDPNTGKPVPIAQQWDTWREAERDFPTFRRNFSEYVYDPLTYLSLAGRFGQGALTALTGLQPTALPQAASWAAQLQRSGAPEGPYTLEKWLAENPLFN